MSITYVFWNFDILLLLKPKTNKTFFTSTFQTNKTKHMKTKLLLILWLFFSTGAYAQQSISYAYDNNGNRTARSILLSKESDTLADSNDEHGWIEQNVNKQTTSLHDQINDFTISIYPNPTKSKIFIQSNAPLDCLDIQLTNSNGLLLEHISSMPGNKYVIDLSAHSSGIYYLRFIGTNESRVWKIIKQ